MQLSLQFEEIRFREDNETLAGKFDGLDVHGITRYMTYRSKGEWIRMK